MYERLYPYKILIGMEGIDEIKGVDSDLAYPFTKFKPYRIGNVGASELAEKFDIVQSREDSRLQPRGFDMCKILGETPGEL